MDRETVTEIGLWTVRILLVIGGIVGGILGSPTVIGFCVVGLMLTIFFL